MIRTQPALKHLTGLTIECTPNHRTCVHIQTNTRTLNLHWGLPHCGSTGQDLIPDGNPRSHVVRPQPPHTV